MSAHWQIGMEVECIDDGDPKKIFHARAPVKGARYVIAEILEFEGGCISLQMTTLRFDGDDDFYPGYRDELFRPIQKRATDISIFTAMLTGTKQTERA